LHSSQKGIASDLKNLFGATVILADGHIRSDEDATEEEREIMFALQGGGGNFGAVTEFKVSCKISSENLFRTSFLLL
jgi:hypothetical protein